MALSKETFSIEGMMPFKGYHDPEKRWNGWAVPYFEWSVAVRITTWINDWSGKGQLRVDKDRGVIIDLEDPEAPFDIEASMTATEDGDKMLYPVGSGWWIWDVHGD